MFRFTFPGADRASIFDNVNNNGGLKLDPAQRRGHRLLRRAQPALRRRQPHLRPRRVRPAGDRQRDVARRGGDKVTGYFRFEPGPDRW